MFLEAQRIEQRTKYDLEMLREVGYCSGIENYSRHFDGRAAGEPPWTLVDYFPDDFLLVIDESHMTLPQVRGMHHGDRSRKEELVKYGFRLPSAIDNRPLKFEEFEQRIRQVIFTTATPGRVRTGTFAAGGAADHPPDRPDRSRSGDQAREGAGGRSDRADSGSASRTASGCW